MKSFSLGIFLFTICSCSIQKPTASRDIIETTVYNKWSESMIVDLQSGKNVSAIQNKLADLQVEELEKILQNDEQRKAFWLNIYNAYIIAILKEDKSKFDDRGAFFTAKQIDIAGEMLSFDDIENGMIRKSQLKWGLGYIGKLFPPKFERDLRVSERDYRIHFALNCGAESCPPVRVFKAETINKQLQNAAASYLKAFTKYNKENNTVETTPLMSWFRGDFGGKSGTKKILKEFNLIPQESNPSLNYGNYRWELDIDNFAK